MRKDVLLLDLYEKRLDGEMIGALDADRQYQIASKEAMKKEEYLNEMKLTNKQKKAVDKAISANNSSNIEGMRVAYQQGFKDALKLLAEIEETSGYTISLKKSH